MTFRVIRPSTTADAADANDNFYHIAQSSRLPMGGSTLEYTDGAYNLGSASYTWNNLYSSSIGSDKITGSNKIFSIITTTALVANTTTIDINVNGDTYTDFKMIGFVRCDTTTSIRIGYNDDSTTTFYKHATDNTDNLLAADIDTNAYIEVAQYTNNTTSAVNTYFVITMASKATLKRVSRFRSLEQTFEEKISRITWGSALWDDATTTITSIQVYGDETLLAGTKIILYGQN